MEAPSRVFCCCSDLEYEHENGQYFGSEKDVLDAFMACAHDRSIECGEVNTKALFAITTWKWKLTSDGEYRLDGKRDFAPRSTEEVQEGWVEVSPQTSEFRSEDCYNLYGSYSRL